MLKTLLKTCIPPSDHMSKNVCTFHSYNRLTCHAPVPRRICTALYGMGVPVIVHKLFSHTTGGKVQLFTVEI